VLKAKRVVRPVTKKKFNQKQLKKLLKQKRKERKRRKKKSMMRAQSNNKKLLKISNLEEDRHFSPSPLLRFFE